MSQETLDVWTTEYQRKLNWQLDVCIIVSPDLYDVKGGADNNEYVKNN